MGLGRNAQRARAEDAGGCVLGRRHYIYTTSRRAKTYGLRRSCRYRNAAASALGRRTSKSTPQRRLHARASLTQLRGMLAAVAL